MATVANTFLASVMNTVKTGLNFIGVGTGAAPSPNDTALASELSRKASTEYIDGLTLVKEAFWDESELNGTTLTNTALFNGGTSSVGTGQVAAGDAINITKDATQTLTVSVEITFEGVGG